MEVEGDIWRAVDWPLGWAVGHVGSTGSTNEDLLAMLEAGRAGDHSVLVADHQTRGRGRLDRRWEAPPGANLLVSMAFSPVPLVAAELTQRVGLAVVGAVRAILPAVDVGLKWPNDVLLTGLTSEPKLAGILAQRSMTADAVVVGLGLNIAWAPKGAAALDAFVEKGHSASARLTSPAGLLAAILTEFDRLPADVTDLYRANLRTLDRTIRIELPGDQPPVVGRALDVDEVGRLLVRSADGQTHRFDVGDVVHVRGEP